MKDLRNNTLFSGQIFYADPDIRAKTREAKTGYQESGSGVGEEWLSLGWGARKGVWVAGRMPIVGVGMVIYKPTL